MNMKKIVLFFSLCFFTANIIQADQTTYCDTADAGRQINAALAKGDKATAKAIYNAHCGLQSEEFLRCPRTYHYDPEIREGESNYYCILTTLKEIPQ